MKLETLHLAIVDDVEFLAIFSLSEDEITSVHCDVLEAVNQLQLLELVQ